MGATIIVADTCHDCHTPVTPATCVMVSNTPRYALDLTTLCYECGRKHDLEQAAETGMLFAYVESHLINTWSKRGWNSVRHNTIDKVTTCVGTKLNVGPIDTRNTWKSNFGDTRTAFTCKLPTGYLNIAIPTAGRALETWHGIAYLTTGNSCRLKRAKAQPTPLMQAIKPEHSDQFHTASGRLTAYALHCGYVERRTSNIPEREIVTELYHEGGCYHIRTNGPDIAPRSLWDTARTLTDAHKLFAQHIKAHHPRKVGKQ